MDTTIISKKPDIQDLELKIKKMYRDVAENPDRKYHFELGRALAEKLGYEKSDLDRIPAQSIESFVGVGYFIDIAGIKEGDKVLDLGSGSGMDSFIASLYAGDTGNVTGVDMTDEQLSKAGNLAEKNGFENVTFVKGYIEHLPFDNNTFDVVISNGVINLSAYKDRVFSEIARVLKSNGRMAIADIVTEQQLPETVTCNAALWASCIGGAGQEDDYKNGIENAGLEVLYIRNNSSYEFLSDSARNSSIKYGVKSVSLFAQKSE